MPEEKPTENKFVVPEKDRKMTVLFTQADSLSLELEALNDKIKDKNDAVLTARYELSLVAGQLNQLQGQHQEYNAAFWIQARKDKGVSDWMRMVQAKGWAIKIERVKVEDTNMVQLVAYNPAEEQILQIRDAMFRNRPGADPDNQSPDENEDE